MVCLFVCCANWDRFPVCTYGREREEIEKREVLRPQAFDAFIFFFQQSHQHFENGPNNRKTETVAHPNNHSSRSERPHPPIPEKWNLKFSQSQNEIYETLLLCLWHSNVCVCVICSRANGLNEWTGKLSPFSIWAMDRFLRLQSDATNISIRKSFIYT